MKLRSSSEPSPSRDVDRENPALIHHLRETLRQLTHLNPIPGATGESPQALVFLTNEEGRKQVGCLARPEEKPRIQGASSTLQHAVAGELRLVLGEMNPDNAARLRAHFPHLRPTTAELTPSAGTGDRLGLATPGHIQAFRQTFQDAGVAQGEVPLFPILAQQSIRENARTGRTPQEVVDDATWGVLEAGWTGGYGADADHLKTTDDVDVCHAAGYTFYTIDPGDHVDDEGTSAPLPEVEAKVRALDWRTLDSSPADLASRMVGRAVDLGTHAVTPSHEDVMRAAAKYGPAVSHTVRMARHLDQRRDKQPYDLEMSVDETATVTSLVEHIYIGSELRRLGIRCVSLAPRYTGRFEKGVDFIGDLDEFARSFADHVAVSRRFGPYKLSLHSGSDKFRIYPIAAELAGDLIHLKTAGTSYLEAVRAIGHLDPALFRRLLDFAVSRYEEDRQAYHVSGRLDRMPPYATMADEALPDTLEDFHTRQVLHVTFGSVLNDGELRPLFFDVLRRGTATYQEMLVKHFVRHLAPFV